MVTRRQALIAGGGAAMAAYLAGCGGSTGATAAAAAAEAAAAARRRGGQAADARPTARSRRATCCSPTGSTTPTPANYKGYTKEYGPKVKVSGFGSNDEILAKLRAGGAKYDVISPTGYAVKTMADLGLIMPLTHELIPNIKNISAGVHEDRLRPGQQVLGAEGLRHHELLLADRQGLRAADDDRRVLRAAQDAGGQGPARQLPRGRHAGHGARARRARLLDQHRGPGARSTRPSSCWSTSSRTSTRSTRRSSSGRRAARSTSAWAGTATSGARSSRSRRRTARWSSSCPRATTEYWVDNWVIPTDAEHPVAAHKWIDYVLDPVERRAAR